MAMLLCFGRLEGVRFFPLCSANRTTSLMSTGATVHGRLQLRPRSAVLRHFPVREASFRPSGGLLSAVGFHSQHFLPGALTNSSLLCSPARGPPPVCTLVPAMCRIRITRRRREEPREILSWPLTWEGLMRSCVGGGTQPGGGTEQATNASSLPKKGRQRAFVHPPSGSPEWSVLCCPRGFF